MLSLGTLLLGLALLIIVALVVALPLFDRKTPAIELPSRREALAQERRAVISAIRELDFDYHTGKISAEDYKRLREARVARGAQILRELAELADEHGATDVEAEIEAQVARLRKVATSDGRAPARAVCPSCSRVVGADDKFCSQCGRRLQPRQSEAVASAE
ncbi:MAG: hypothetical protein D6709_01710 [Chloroflexi bacterium]|jgi:rRNA maturation endonuclease Nob1|uniref:Zinc-ribbon domain-containing protein n=1 Tax=Candidatus Thermofonsia Clade 3 bacterium TaxID=2364212 RepID=A0A2M8QBJ0_9CHLR|nr:zinc ribbon domain-containing protein [Candidatus Roseilinea sp. NK_OTU-006]PJF47162.1 MAG: hypothetical protein CUN48_10130 [Candidatus Thermofonsia Clade 3 bacterium]RMG65755.1 MAG: hypothetical protein D6709_01710 [Chloroflexota bacterium]